MIWAFLGVGLIFIATVLFGAPYIPTHRKQFINLLEKLDFDKSKDIFIDLGSGDGKILRLVSPYVKLAVGFEINPILVFISKLLSRKIDNIEITFGNYLTKVWPEGITHVYLFQASPFIKSLTEKIISYDKELTIISYGFEIPTLENGFLAEGFFVYNIKTTKKLNHKI